MTSRTFNMLTVLLLFSYLHTATAQQVIIRRAAIAAPGVAASQPAAESQADIPEHLSTTQPGSTQPSIPTPSADFELHEWAIFVAEPLAPRANSVSVIKSSLPTFASARRPDAAGDKRNDVMPIGVIRIIGGAAPSPKFDVLLNMKAGDFQGHWPKAESRNNRLLWTNLIADETKPNMSQVDSRHWMNRVRDGASRYLTAVKDSRGERALVYDAEPNFTMPLKFATAGDSGYSVSNSGYADITNLELYKRKPDGWHSAFIETLPASSAAKAAKPTTRSDDSGKLKAGDNLTITVQNVSEGHGEGETVKKTKLAASGSVAMPVVGSVVLLGKTSEEAEKLISEKYAAAGLNAAKVKIVVDGKEASPTPATGPSGPATEMTLSSTAVADPKQQLAAWKDRLAATGLTPIDTDLILDILANYAIDSGRLTAVYMLDRKQMDDLIAEEVVPVPAKTVRVGLVIVRNIDPAINEEIATLVKQLGDDEWAKREEAQKKLMTFGRAAKSALDKAAKEKDLEVVWRAEAVLRSIDPMKPQPQAGF